MSPFKPDNKTVYRTHCTSCGNKDQSKFEIVNRSVVCKGCGSAFDGIVEKAEKSVYESQKKS